MVCNYVCHFVWTNAKLSNFRTGDRKSYMGEKRFCERCQNIGIGTKTYHNTIADLVNYENKHWWTLMDCKLSKMKCKKSWLEIFFFSSENPAVPTWNLSGSHGDLFFLSTRHSHTRTQSHTHSRPLSPSTLNIRQQWAVGQTDVMSQFNCCDNSWWLVFVYVWLF